MLTLTAPRHGRVGLVLHEVKTGDPQGAVSSPGGGLSRRAAMMQRLARLPQGRRPGPASLPLCAGGGISLAVLKPLEPVTRRCRTIARQVPRRPAVAPRGQGAALRLLRKESIHRRSGKSSRHAAPPVQFGPRAIDAETESRSHAKSRGPAAFLPHILALQRAAEIPVMSLDQHEAQARKRKRLAARERA